MTNVIKTNEENKKLSLNTSDINPEVEQQLKDYFTEQRITYISDDKEWLAFRKTYVNVDKDPERKWKSLGAGSLIDQINMKMGIELSHHDLKQFSIKNGFARVFATSVRLDRELQDGLNKAKVESEFWLSNSEEYVLGDIQPVLLPEIDLYFTSLSGGKEENKTHLFEWLAAKIFNPCDSVTLPALNIFGEGGTGKNLFFERLLPKIFHSGAIARTSMKSLGGFNAEHEGALFLIFNESLRDKADSEGLKDLIGSLKNRVEKKGKDSYEVDNLMSAILFTNDNFGSISLDKQGGANRRYSIIKAEKTLQDIVKTEANLKTNREIEGYIDEIVRLLTDTQAIMGFVKYLEVNHLKETPPKALHGKDYKNLVAKTKNTVEMVCDYVFKPSNETNCVKKTMVFELCKIVHQKETGRLLNSKTMKDQLGVWIKNNGYVFGRTRMKDGSQPTSIHKKDFVVEDYQFNKKLFMMSKTGFDGGYSNELIDNILDDCA